MKKLKSSGFISKAFLQGMGSVPDISGSSFKPPKMKSDAEAIASDWKKVGGDFYAAFEKELCKDKFEELSRK